MLSSSTPDVERPPVLGGPGRPLARKRLAQRTASAASAAWVHTSSPKRMAGAVSRVSRDEPLRRSSAAASGAGIGA